MRCSTQRAFRKPRFTHHMLSIWFRSGFWNARSVLTSAGRTCNHHHHYIGKYIRVNCPRLNCEPMVLHPIWMLKRVTPYPYEQIVGLPAIRRSARILVSQALKGVDRFNAPQQISTRRFNAFQHFSTGAKLNRFNSPTIWANSPAAD